MSVVFCQPPAWLLYATIIGWPRVLCLSVERREEENHPCLFKICNNIMSAWCSQFVKLITACTLSTTAPMHKGWCEVWFWTKSLKHADRSLWNNQIFEMIFWSVYCWGWYWWAMIRLDPFWSPTKCCALTIVEENVKGRSHVVLDVSWDKSSECTDACLAPSVIVKCPSCGLS